MLCLCLYHFLIDIQWVLYDSTSVSRGRLSPDYNDYSRPGVVHFLPIQSLLDEYNDSNKMRHTSQTVVTLLIITFMTRTNTSLNIVSMISKKLTSSSDCRFFVYLVQTRYCVKPLINAPSLTRIKRRLQRPARAWIISAIKQIG